MTIRALIRAESGRTGFYEARLRASDEKRSAELDADDRVWRPDDDEPADEREEKRNDGRAER